MKTSPNEFPLRPDPSGPADTPADSAPASAGDLPFAVHINAHGCAAVLSPETSRSLAALARKAIEQFGGDITAYDHLRGDYCHGWADHRPAPPRARAPGWLKAALFHQRSPLYVIRQWIRWQVVQTGSPV